MKRLVFMTLTLLLVSAKAWAGPSDISQLPVDTPEIPIAAGPALIGAVTGAMVFIRHKLKK